MINKRMAENYLSDSASIFSEAKAAKDRGLNHRAIRLSQESLERTLKAILRAIGVEYPKEHEVSEAIQENLEKLPQWFRTLAFFILSMPTIRLPKGHWDFSE